jgi:hypothetical protein
VNVLSLQLAGTTCCVLKDPKLPYCNPSSFPIICRSSEPSGCASHAFTELGHGSARAQQCACRFLQHGRPDAAQAIGFGSGSGRCQLVGVGCRQCAAGESHCHFRTLHRSGRCRRVRDPVRLSASEVASGQRRVLKIVLSRRPPGRRLTQTDPLYRGDNHAFCSGLSPHCLNRRFGQKLREFLRWSEIRWKGDIGISGACQSR